MSASLRIVNVIATSRVKGQINIELLSQVLRKAQYDPGTFPGLVYRKTGYPTIIMFASGKISSHGAKSEIEAKKAILDTVKEIKSLGAVVGNSLLEKIEIENVVGAGDLNSKPDIELIARLLPNSIYEPDQFPGLMHRPFANSIVCLIFGSGKIVIVGAKSENQVERTFQHMDEFVKGI